MPILMPIDTRAALGENAARCESRSLFMDRFADPGAKDDARKVWFAALVKKSPVTIERVWAGSLPGVEVFFAQLQSRLMINMAGGVMENAGLCLDRFGLPYIPGSALKGCARRMAIQHLLAEPDIQKKAALLVEISRVFGCSDADWGDKADFAYASGEQRGEVFAQALAQLPGDTFAADVNFLPAHPVQARDAALPVPYVEPGKLELDIVTCHHQDYYAGKDAVALDNDDPIPVMFPAVASGHVFRLCLVPRRGCPEARLKTARQWLIDGLALLGLGAKTAAGYGWFDCSESLQSAVAGALAKRDKQAREDRERQLQETREREQKEAERLQRERDKAAMAAMSPEEQEDYKISSLNENQFRSALENFETKAAAEKNAIIRALRKEPGVAGSRSDFWVEVKNRAKKGKKIWVRVEQAIRTHAKTMYPGKEGKMP